ncbi:CinA family protein [Paraburkholderia acidisoli]|uniref:Ompetence-damaged protein n=1 Tax=Paraburkholderia acidisoli TaxID=2571748 RepID=A0A7Z2GIV2_9BURK|nr:CinA family protein [Paraburkholderia acidisoli]QGZ62607.1 ompetence-damaged protein [Paraburkholderia acidisoli]
MNVSKQIVGYLISRSLVLASVETCTAGAIAAMLAEQRGAPRCLALGYIAYPEAAIRTLPGVQAPTLDREGALSEAVAREAAQGALGPPALHPANAATVAFASMGTLSLDHDDPRAVVAHCFAWACRHGDRVYCESETVAFSGTRHDIRRSIARRALLGVPRFVDRIARM